MAKVMRLRGPTGKGESGLKSASLNFLKHLPPESRVCLPYCNVISTLLTLIGAILDQVSLEKVTLQL